MVVNIDGLNIEYTEKGSGIPVLLLHGWGSSFDVYNGIMSALEDRCRLVALNFPGCGNSDTMESPWNIDDYCNLVIKFIKLELLLKILLLTVKKIKDLHLVMKLKKFLNYII